MATRPDAAAQRRVVVTGMGAVTPLGLGVPALLRGWLRGESGIRDGAGRCVDFDPDAILTRREVRRSDRFTQLVLAAAQEAVEQAGWNGGPPVDAARAGSIVGTGFGGLGTVVEQAERRRVRGGGAVSPLAISMMMPNAACAALAIRHGLRGRTVSVSSACASGGDALGAAFRAIQHGDADTMLAGGGDACVLPLAIDATAMAGALSRSGCSRPFDARRDGFVMSEGAAVLVLEAADVAAARGAPALGEVVGFGATVDGFHLAAPDPGGEGARRAIELALADAGVGPEDLDYVNAHGTGTELNDRTETAALKAVLGPDAYRLPVSSTKSVTGHLLGGAGAAEAAVTLLALAERVVPPTAGWAVREEGLDLDYVPAARPLELRPGADRALALSNSFGFGGQNAVLCLAVEAAEPPAQRTALPRSGVSRAGATGDDAAGG